MKKESWITVAIVTICFVAGIVLSDYLRSGEDANSQVNVVANIDSNESTVTQQKNTAPKSSPKDLLGKLAPDFSLNDASGKLRNVSEWEGKVLVINFWATWCPPCLEEIPHFIELQDKYASQGLQFLGIALENVDTVVDFAKQHGMNYPLLVGERDVIALAGKFGNRVGGLPYTVVLDRNGQINFIKQGPLSSAEAEQVITSLL